MRVTQLTADVLYNYIIDIVFLVLLFKKTKPDKSPNIFRIILGTSALLALFVLYITTLIPGKARVILLLDGVSRSFVRVLLTAIYLWSFRKGNVIKSVYLGIYYLILCNSYLIISKLVSVYFIGEQHSSACIIFRHICMIVVFISAYLLVDINKIRNVGFTRIAAISLNALCFVYIKSSIRFVSRVMTHSTTLLYFILMLIIFLFINVITTERSLSAQEEIAKIKTQKIVDSYMLKHYHELQKNNENIRTLAHDMKNHLHAIHKMSENGENEKINSYIDSMVEKFSLNNNIVKTGNELIDGVISEKMSESSQLGINYSILLDARLLKNISDIDLCTFFGNALDNAIEACEKVNERDKRFISIKSGISANQTIIEISNSCQGNLVFADGMSVTTKADKENHGIGLKSIKKTAEKYGGMISIEASSPETYKLILMIPQK